MAKTELEKIELTDHNRRIELTLDEPWSFDDSEGQEPEYLEIGPMYIEARPVSHKGTTQVGWHVMIEFMWGGMEHEHGPSETHSRIVDEVQMKEWRTLFAQIRKAMKQEATEASKQFHTDYCSNVFSQGT